MPTADTTLLRHAMEVSGSLLYAVTTVILVFGLLVVAFSFRDSEEKGVRPGPRPR